MTKLEADKLSAERVSPGEFLKRKMAYYGLTAATLAEEIDVHVQTIYNATTGKRPISAKLAAKLARRFVEQMDVWLSDTIELTPLDTSQATRPQKAGRNSGNADNVIEMPLFAKPAERSSGILIDREIAALLQRGDSGVSITPFKSAQVEPASYDLTIGMIIVEGFRDLSEYDWVSVLKYTHDRETLSLREKERVTHLLEATKSLHFVPAPAAALNYVTLNKLQSVILVAREMVQFDKYHLADVGGTARNGINGLFVNHGFQIDPGYSGPMFFTAINIGIAPLKLNVGDKLASLAIRRLHRPPERAYHADIERQIRSIALRMDEALKQMFEYKALAKGEYKAQSDRFEETFVASSLEDVQNDAVSLLIKDLSKGYDNPMVSASMLQAVHDAIESISIDRTEAEALTRHFKILDQTLIDKALSGFRMRGMKQTLRDTVTRLGLDPLQCLVALLDGE